MARTPLTVQPIPATGLTGPVYGAAALQNSIPNNNGRMYLHIKNGSGAPITATVVTPGEIGGLAISDRVFTVPATTGEVVTPFFPPGLFNQTDGSVYVDFSAVTTVTVACLHHL